VLRIPAQVVLRQLPHAVTLVRQVIVGLLR
jgi:hypothetical protein